MALNDGIAFGICTGGMELSIGGVIEGDGIALGVGPNDVGCPLGVAIRFAD